MTSAGFRAPIDFPISQADVDLFATVIGISSFALLWLLAWQLSKKFSVIPLALGLGVAAILAAALGILVQYRVIVTNERTPLNSVEMMALSAGIISATAIVFAIILLPIPGYKPAFVRIGLAMISGAAVLAVSSLVAQEIIIRSEAQSFPIAYLVMPKHAVLQPDSGPPLNPNGRTAIWLIPDVPKQYAVGQSVYIRLLVRSQVSAIRATRTMYPPYEDFAAASGSTVSRCLLNLKAKLVAPAFDQNAGNDATINVDPKAPPNIAYWSWILTPKTDGLQLLYIHSDWSVAAGAKNCMKSYASPVAYDEYRYVQVSPAFLTISGLPQWLALLATIVGIASTTFGMFKRP